MENIVVHENRWLSLMAVPKGDGDQDYIYSHETRCQGKIVLVLPFRTTEYNETQYLVRHEITPCWNSDFMYSGITGGYEGVDIADDAVREVLEETGYAITKQDLISLGTCFASKSADTVYHLYTVNLTDYEQGEILGDGSSGEADASAVWVDMKDILSFMDAQLSCAALRLNNILN